MPRGRLVVMITPMTRAASLTIVALGLSGLGCSASGRALRSAPPAALAEPAPVLAWEDLARPDGLYTIATFVGLVGAQEGPCPRVERSGSVTTVHGKCTDPQGDRIEGKARVIERNGETLVRLRGYGDAEAKVWGRVRLWTEPRPHFTIDLRIEPGLELEHVPGPAPAWTAIEAEGHRDEHGAWQAEGRLAAEGHGRVRMRATDVVLGDECSHEPLRGTTELWAGDEHVVITYDGATDCDSDGTARWSRNGVDQGELSGIDGSLSCDADEQQGGGAVPMSGAMLLMLGLRRRREPRAPGPTR